MSTEQQWKEYDDEVAFIWSHRHATKSPEEMERLWLEAKPLIQEARKAFPVYELGKKYTREEFNVLYWLDQAKATMFEMNNSTVVAKPVQLETRSETPTGEMKPREFIAALTIGVSTLVPRHVKPASVRTAASNARVKISTMTDSKGQLWVTRLF